jgi:hypothetical protein
MLQISRVLALALTLTALTGCGPRWVVLSQATPNVLHAQREFAVMPMDFTGLRVGEKEEGAYLAAKDEGQRAAWAGDKAEVNAKFVDALVKEAAEHDIRVVLAQGTGSAPFLLRPHVAMLEPGYYAGIAAAPGVAKIELQVLGSDGRPVDVIVVEGASGGFSVTMRLAGAGSVGGTLVARYLAERVR